MSADDESPQGFYPPQKDTYVNLLNAESELHTCDERSTQAGFMVFFKKLQKQDLSIYQCSQQSPEDLRSYLEASKWGNQRHGGCCGDGYGVKVHGSCHPHNDGSKNPASQCTMSAPCSVWAALSGVPGGLTKFMKKFGQLKI